MAVIMDRALPDVRDGLKPVQRRILYTMHEMGLYPNRKYIKSARVVGDVMGKYHPHGDAAIYDAMVRLAQDWNLRYPTVDGQGNFGSIDGDKAAAHRYTEAKMAPITEALLLDIDKETVDFKDNYDGTNQEPETLPSSVPNLLMNGSTGIAVGMATNIAPHNLNEIVDGLIALIDNPKINIDGLMEHIKGPDFPTGGVMSNENIKKSFETGRGSIKLRARVLFEERNNRHSIVVTEIPYQVNKTSLIQNVAKLVRLGKITDIAKYRDESDRQGMRVVFDIKRGAHPEVVLHQLYKYTQLQSSFSVNNMVIVNKKPMLLSLKQMLRYYLDHRVKVFKRRSRFELRKAKERTHILEGYLIALDRLDEVIALIRASKDGATAKKALMEAFELSSAQAQAVLDMRLQRLTGLEREKLLEEYRLLNEEIARLEAILANKSMLWEEIKKELLAVKKKYGDERKTQIITMSDAIGKEDLIAEEHMVVTMTRGGYIKRTPLSRYRAQSRGGRGVSSQNQKEDDVNSLLLVGSSHDYLLFFSDRGKVYREKIYDLPQADRNARGNHLRNILPLEGEEKIETVLSLRSFDMDGYFVFATRKGIIKRTDIRSYSNINVSGLIAINLQDDDELVRVNITDGEADVLLATHDGQAIRFAESKIRETGRATQGVIGIRLRNDDFVVSLATIAKEDKETAELLAVSENGFGKRTKLSEYPQQNRGGLGVITLKVTDKTGKLVSLSHVSGEEELFVLSQGGVLIRTRLSEVSSYGRSSQGVTIMKLGAKDMVVSAEVLPSDALIKAKIKAANKDKEKD